MSFSPQDSADLRRDELPTGAEQSLDHVPDPEVSTKGKRRYLTAAYKARILRLADACTKPGELGALLRREGLYSSHLTKWRRQRDVGQVPPKRGRKKDPATAERQEIARQQKEIARLAEKLRKAELIIEVQKKVAALLGNPLPPVAGDETP
jgi:transposase-like protein